MYLTKLVHDGSFMTSAVHRTGPHPEASDYSKTLLQALVDDVGGSMKVGSVTRVQLLLTCLVERLHDAIYVLPRHARNPDASQASPDPEEYAKDVAGTLRALKKYALELPNDTVPIEESHVDEVNKRIAELRIENQVMLEEAKSVQLEIYTRLTN